MVNLRIPHPEDRAEGLSRQQLEIMRSRAAVAGTESDPEPFPTRRSLYEPGLKDSRTGYVPAPNRRVATHWKTLRCDRRNCSIVFEGDGTLKDPNAFALDVGPFKVRWLLGPKEGAVEDLDGLGYLHARAAFFGHFPMVNVEPVPDDEPLCGPARPPNMPSSFAKARRIAGKGLKADPEALSFEEVVRFFRKP